MEFNRYKSYNTLNVYRSAISPTLHLIQGVKIGEHPIVSRCLNCVHICKPPTPRYNSTWNVSMVTAYLASQTPLNELSLKNLTLKTAMLCSLVCAQREQTLCLLDLSNKMALQNALKFTITDRHKTARPGKTLEVYIPSLPSNVNLCPVSTLQEYLNRTEPLRHIKGHYSSKVFISYTKPHKEITTSTLARWIKVVLELSGIDTTLFKAHSVRGASTSALYSRGANLNEILQMANCSNEKTFHRFYNRADTRSVIGRLVLE